MPLERDHQMLAAVGCTTFLAGWLACMLLTRRRSSSGSASTGAVGATEDNFSDPGGSEDLKLLLVVRTDLKMGKGKAAAQCCHATLAAYKQLVRSDPAMVRRWELLGQPKIVVKAPDEPALLELRRVAIQHDVNNSIIQVKKFKRRDQRTEIPSHLGKKHRDWFS
eukprot:m.83146 g.83146  ORF g.83146 m.83146 type:complete len:165 (-) comp14755_c1_seq3:53-547(-)